MALSVSRDLSVNTSPNYVEEKLEDKQKGLQESIEKGEPKIFGVSQIVIGLMIISYSIPLLLFSDNTMILYLGVPWWSAVMSIISGAAAITLEKNATMKTFSTCLAISCVAIIISAIAVILYYADIASNPATECQMGQRDRCDHRHYATLFSRGIKITISVVALVQTAVSSAFTLILYNQMRKFTGYTV
ncbi:hypothetical protein DNTS_001678, partial [Danionella cerebrum]